MKFADFRTRFLAAFLALALGACSGAQNPAVSQVQAAPAPMADGGQPVRATGGPDFSVIVERYGPAVVNISTTRMEKASMQVPDELRNSPFFQFFFRGQPGVQPREQQMPAHGVGSGFIVSADGYILTNAHVVKDAGEVQVKLTDRREFTAKVVGSDARTDIALLKIDAGGLPTVKLGDPEKLKVGSWVLAIGSPFGFENSVTSGIVSAKARALPDENYVPFIQTDVAVNPGNSGGPLFNLDGEVVGINSQIYSRSGGYMGLSFAIPIDVALNVKTQLQATGKVTRGRLGVTVQNVTQDLARSFGMAKPEGALVSNVESDGPAAKAGVLAGDVITKLDGKTVESSTQLPVAVAALKPGTTVPVEVWRQGSPKALKVTVAELSEPQVAAANTGKGGADGGKLGLVARSLTPEEKREAQVEGVVVEGVSGPSARAGIEPGDLILAVNGTPVRDVEQLRKLAAKTGKTVALLVQRGDAKMYVPVNVG